MKTLLILCLFFTKAYSYDINDWASTEYIYIAKPIYIYKVESHSDEIDGKLGNKLSDLIVKMKKSLQSKNHIYYYFEIQEVLYGETEKFITIDFEFEDKYTKCNLKNNFDDHNNSEFWNTEIGRSVFSKNKTAVTNCFGEYRDTRRVDSCFEIDKQYLLIKNDNLKTKQYELIDSVEDNWLQHVRLKAKEIAK
jgi:hypothetical protein